MTLMRKAVVFFSDGEQRQFEKLIAMAVHSGALVVDLEPTQGGEAWFTPDSHYFAPGTWKSAKVVTYVKV